MLVRLLLVVALLVSLAACDSGEAGSDSATLQIGAYVGTFSFPLDGEPSTFRVQFTTDRALSGDASATFPMTATLQDAERGNPSVVGDANVSLSGSAVTFTAETFNLTGPAPPGASSRGGDFFLQVLGTGTLSADGRTIALPNASILTDSGGNTDEGTRTVTLTYAGD